MNTLITLMLVTAGILFIVAFVWITSPRKKDTFNIHIDKGTAVSVSQSEDGGIRLDFNYESYETRPSDDELFPDIVNTAGPTTPLTRGFWQQVAVIDELEAEEKESLCSTLLKYGIISQEQANAIIFGDGEEGESESKDGSAASEETTPSSEPDANIATVGIPADDSREDVGNAPHYVIDDDDDFENDSLID